MCSWCRHWRPILPLDPAVLHVALQRSHSNTIIGFHWRCVPRDVLLVGIDAGHVFGLHGRVKVDIEGEDVKREDEGDDPLEHGAGVVVSCEGTGDEGDGEEDFDNDEDELNPEGDAQDSVVTVA
jgi:hypothetical protein